MSAHVKIGDFLDNFAVFLGVSEIFGHYIDCISVKTSSIIMKLSDYIDHEMLNQHVKFDEY